MKFSWQQPYEPNNRWNKWAVAKISIDNHRQLIELDRLEPIVDLVDAQQILRKFTLESDNGN